ncbi:MAG: MFS transporter [Arachnia propionica]|nr:MAG: MFS transporter [Arachnia propionica]
MSHYFSPNPEVPLRLSEISAKIFGRDLTFATAPGVFSASRLDPGTAVLLRSVTPPSSGHVLDLGCGFGPIAVGMAAASPAVTVDAIDVNERAVWLTDHNAQLAGVADRVAAGTPEQFAESHYDQIWSNPPIRIGKAALHELLLTWLPRLRPGGVAYLVVGKNLGADSLTAWLNQLGWATEKLASAKGFRVLQANARAA